MAQRRRRCTRRLGPSSVPPSMLQPPPSLRFARRLATLHAAERRLGADKLVGRAARQPNRDSGGNRARAAAAGRFDAAGPVRACRLGRRRRWWAGSAGGPAASGLAETPMAGPPAICATRRNIEPVSYAQPQGPPPRMVCSAYASTAQQRTTRPARPGALPTESRAPDRQRQRTRRSRCHVWLRRGLRLAARPVGVLRRD